MRIPILLRKLVNKLLPRPMVIESLRCSGMVFLACQ
jgi:hypothetical protein